MSTPVTIERYAQMRAEMDAGTLRDEVLARAGLTTDEWTNTQRAWLEKMGTELERGRFELTNRYTQAFLQRQRALSAAAVPPPAPAPTPVPYIKPEPLPPPMTAPPPLLLRDLPPLPVPDLPPLPPAGPPLPPPPSMTAFAGGTTLPIDLAQLQTKDPLPFKPAPPDPDTSDATTDFYPGATLAFELTQRRDQDAPPRTMDPPDAGVPDFFASTTDFEPGSTLPPVDPRWLPGKDVLPFKMAPPDAKTPNAIDQEGFASATKLLPWAAATDFDPAATVPIAPDGSQDRGALPFRPGGAPPPQRPEASTLIEDISLRTYAEICARLRVSSGKIDQLLLQYGLDALTWMALHSLWQKRISHDSTLRSSWETLVKDALSLLPK